MKRTLRFLNQFLHYVKQLRFRITFFWFSIAADSFKDGPQRSLTPGSCVPVWPPALEGSLDLVICFYRIWQRWQDVISVLRLWRLWLTVVKGSTVFLACTLWWGKLPCWRGLVPRNRVASSQQLARNWGPQSNSPWGMEPWQPTNQWVNFKVSPAPSELRPRWLRP